MQVMSLKIASKTQDWKTGFRDSGAASGDGLGARLDVLMEGGPTRFFLLVTWADPEGSATL